MCLDLKSATAVTPVKKYLVRLAAGVGPMNGFYTRQTRFPAAASYHLYLGDPPECAITKEARLLGF